MKKYLLIALLIPLLTSCSKDDIRENEGIVNEENLNILTSINELAIDTFIPKKGLALSNEEDIDKDTNPKLKSDNKDELKKNIGSWIGENPKAKWVYDNFDDLDNIDAYLAGNDEDTIEFVYNMNNGLTNFPYTPGQSVDLERKTPYYIQWDNRWAYNKLGNRNIGISGCGPTSMAMILSRLKKDNSITPDKIAKDAQNYMGNEGISWNFFYDGAKKYDYEIEDVALNEEAMKKALEKGPLLVSVNRGYFTLFGHIFVIDSYKDGKFIINDPNSLRNSKIEWTFDQISNQIVKIWSIY
ncbi:C39 family peptidase [Anaerococcus provencensis]|uniref:C39 family peptidase n=1 Tax=Anaerococcus provencensis TaxID=938293 RepID=UPI0003083EB9|nr:C39 family peptidase [Anaerococcus provencensis]